jgi:alpha-ketoglutarate-dependent taurine dioxygenase
MSPRTETFTPGATLPLVVRPADDRERDASALAAWLAAERATVDGWLTAHGALLFRGFAVRDAEAFDRVALALDPELKTDYLGTSPRNALSAHTFTASELPGFYPIPQHCEMSFVKQPPRRLYFACLRANDGPGGETPLADFRAVLRDLDPAVRARFEARGVKNIRNYRGPKARRRVDPWQLKRWDEMFQTTDRAEAERKAIAGGFDVEWKSGDRLVLVNSQPATRAHPVTGVPVWFNHAQVFHPSAAAGEYRRIARRQQRWKYGFLARFASALTRAKGLFSAVEDQAMTCTYGDGAPIPDADMEAVRDAIWKNLVVTRWQQGDVVAIDNFAVSHGRMPYSGPRVIAVAWS